MKFTLFGHTVAPKQDLESRLSIITQRDKLEKKVERLERENKKLKEEKQYIDVEIADPVPDASTDEGQKRREAYVSKVAEAHNSWLKPKLKQMSAEIRDMLTNTENEERMDMVLKGADYFCWELIRWGDSMVREQQAVEHEDSNINQ